MATTTVTIVDVYLVNATPAAYLIRDIDYNDHWIPRSQVIDIQFGDNVTDEDETELKEIRSIEITEWIAKQKGLI